MAKNDEKKIKAGEDDGSLKEPGLTPNSKPASKKIEVDEGLLRELIASNKLLQDKVDKLDSNAVATNPNGIQVRRKIKESDFKLRKWEDKLVLGLENVGNEKRPLYVYNIYDEATRKDVQYCNLLLEGNEKPVKVDWLRFLRDAEIVIARKVSQVEHEDVKEYGMIPKKEMAENGYGMFETMVMVPVEVISKTFTFILKLEDGREISVGSQWVNM